MVLFSSGSSSGLISTGTRFLDLISVIAILFDDHFRCSSWLLI